MWRSYVCEEGVCVTEEADSDGDGVPDADDVCEGYDDNVDTDEDGIPDGCDTEEESTDCGTDFDCFIAASEDCSLASVTHEVTIDLFGMDLTTTSYYEIQGMDQDDCLFYIRTEEQHIEFSDDLVQSLLDSGYTEEEISQEEDDSNDAADLVEGKDGTCRFDTADLTDMLTRWQEGSFSSDDWDVAECEGTFFTPEIE